MNHAPFDFKARARRALIEAGFQPDFPPDVLDEVRGSSRIAGDRQDSGIKDLRGLLWSSIDNKESRDLDQIEYAEMLEHDVIRLLVGIADVDEHVPKSCATDLHAGVNTVTIYAGACVFPMLPPELSTGKTSLLNDNERRAMVIEMHIESSGELRCADIYPARVENRARLNYPSIGDWIDGRTPLPSAVASVNGLEDQLRLQLEAAKRLRATRREQGALTFGSIEASPVIENDEVKGLTISRHNAASDIIESFMVAANVAMARHLREIGRLSLRRVVRQPKRWDRIREIAEQHGTTLPGMPDAKALQAFLEGERKENPEQFPDLSLSVVKLLGPGEYMVETAGEETQGHFGLAVHDYSHATAPNRRYADLVMQRLLKAAAAKAASPYEQSELASIAAHCTERENASRKVERLMRKVAACVLLQSRIGEVFDGIVTGASPKGTYARLFKLPAEGMVARGARGVDVGDKIRVKLLAADSERGFIDFERV